MLHYVHVLTLLFVLYEQLLCLVVELCNCWGLWYRYVYTTCMCKELACPEPCQVLPGQVMFSFNKQVVLVRHKHIERMDFYVRALHKGFSNTLKLSSGLPCFLARDVHVLVVLHWSSVKNVSPSSLLNLLNFELKRCKKQCSVTSGSHILQAVLIIPSSSLLVSCQQVVGFSTLHVFLICAWSITHRSKIVTGQLAMPLHGPSTKFKNQLSTTLFDRQLSGCAPEW